MVSRLRLARVDAAAYPSADDGAPATAERHARLTALIRRHLPQVAAATFAAPLRREDAGVVEWYTELAGQPVPLALLPAAERDAARALLADRLRSVDDLAGRLGADGSQAEDAAELRRALSFPGEEAVYVIGGQPVVTFWGHRAPGAPPLAAAAAAGAAPAMGVAAAGAQAAGGGSEYGAPNEAAAASGDGAQGARGSRRLWPWLWLASILLLAGLAALFAYLVLGWGWRLPPWGPDYPKLIAAAEDDERRLRERLTALEEDLRGRLETCALQDALRQARSEGDRLLGAAGTLEAQVRQALELCPLRGQLDQARQEGRRLGAAAADLERDLAQKLAECRRQADAERRQAEQRRRAAEAEAEARRRQAERPPPPQPPAADPPAEDPAQAKLPPCPGERTAEEAPDVAVVLDASGSMGFPASASANDIQRQLQRMGGLPGLLGSIIVQQSAGPSRLEEAKKGVTNVVRSLPQDVDVGLAVLQSCPRADNLGFYTGAQRPALYERVRRLSPQKGTPLAQGLREAGTMVDGVKAPGVIVVISDGEDSCGGNPCAAARALKAAKPEVVINVVDILGNGAGKCMAAVTGGRVLKPEDGLAFEKTIRKAAEEALKPAHCP
jgi:Mg-chelatase subunit ChlD